MIGRTTDSALVICDTGAGRYYYKGVGLRNGGLSVVNEDPVATGVLTEILGPVHLWAMTGSLPGGDKGA